MRAYEEEPPAPPPGQKQGVDLNNFPLKIIKLEIDQNPAKKGWNRMKASIPVAIRQRHMDDPVYGPEWRNLMLDFDEKYLNSNNQLSMIHVMLMMVHVSFFSLAS